MSLDYFLNYHVGHLRLNLRQNLARYAERRPWADRRAGDRAVSRPSGLEPAVPLELVLPEGTDLKDLENTKIVHQAFEHITPLQARDPRLWTRLTHVECWSYMRKRWDVTRVQGDDAKKERYVRKHYFVTQAQSRALLHNGMARLWWYGHLTHDRDRPDPYQLTAVLLSSLDIAQQVLERNMGRAPHVRTGFLDFIRTNGNRLGTAGQRRDRIRDLAKMLNLRGGFTLLDTLAIEDVIALLGAELQLRQPD